MEEGRTMKDWTRGYLWFQLERRSYLQPELPIVYHRGPDMLSSHRNWSNNSLCAWDVVLWEELKICPLIGSKTVLYLANNLFSEGWKKVGIILRGRGVQHN